MTRASRHRPPSREALARLCAAIAPRARPANVRRLPGGAMMAMHTIDLVEPSGARRRLVIRRRPPDAPAIFADFLLQGWRVLQLLEAAGLPAPRPVYADPNGEIFDGAPTIVITRVAGRTGLRPANLERWCGDLGAALAAIHALPLADLPPGVLSAEDSFVDDIFEQMKPAEGRPTRFERHQDGRAVAAAMQAWRGRLDPVAPGVIHGDFCPENALWSRGRLTAVVDWDFAKVDHPGVDVGYCRMGLALVFGPEAPDLFLRAYEAELGRPFPQPFFWDLLGAGYAMPDAGGRAARYRDLGRDDLDEAVLRERFRRFIARALDASGATSRSSESVGIATGRAD